jgi:hypothetical protein
MATGRPSTSTLAAAAGMPLVSASIDRLQPKGGAGGLHMGIGVMSAALAVPAVHQSLAIDDQQLPDRKLAE